MKRARGLYYTFRLPGGQSRTVRATTQYQAQRQVGEDAQLLAVREIGTVSARGKRW